MKLRIAILGTRGIPNYHGGFEHMYFHGHSVGGTNPSLLEAMASEDLIAAHNNPFNKSVLHSDAFYFFKRT